MLLFGNLRKEQISHLLNSGQITKDNIRPFIYQQVEATPEARLAVLEKLGVIVYKPAEPEKLAVEPPVVRPEIRMMDINDPRLAGLPLFNPKPG